ncbi:uncharacterized protein LJ206_004428 isoform 2-T2 [Theristicus caerulescens]
METCLVTAVPVGDGHPTSQLGLVREPQGDPTDVAGGDGYPASWLDSRADAQGDGMDVGTGRAFPPSRMDRALELTWHARGPQRAKYKAEIGKSSQQPSEVLKEILKDLEKAAHGIGKHFHFGSQEDAHEFLCFTGDALQKAGLNGSTNKVLELQSSFRYV